MEDHDNWFTLHQSATVGGVKDGEVVSRKLCPICGIIGQFDNCSKCLAILLRSMPNCTK